MAKASKAQTRNSDNDITADFLRSILHYDPSTGFFTWIRCSSKKSQTLIGKLAGGKNVNGYRVIGIRYKHCYAHRLAWLYMTGSWPTKSIDHINRNPSDNRWKNLRQAEHIQNMSNLKTRKNNKYGFVGITPHQGGWRAMIMVSYRNYHLGVFPTQQQAFDAYQKASRKIRGEFSPV